MDAIRRILDEGASDEGSQLLVGAAAIAAGLVGVVVVLWLVHALVFIAVPALFRGLATAMNPFGSQPARRSVAAPVQAATQVASQQQSPKSNQKGKPKKQPAKSQPKNEEPSKVKAAAKQAAPEEVSRPRARNDTPSTECGVIKGFKGEILCTAANHQADLLFVASEDRIFRLYTASTLGKGNTFVNCRLDKATVTQAAFDADGRTLALYLDNERSMKVFSVCTADKDPLKLIWHAKLPPVGIDAISVGPGGGYCALYDDQGSIMIVDRKGKEVDRQSAKAGTARQWTVSSSGTLIGLAASMTSSCRVVFLQSGNRSTMDDGPLWAGVEVSAKDTTTGKYHSATVVEVDEMGTYTIKWYDGTDGFCMPRNCLRPKGVQTIGEEYGSMRHVMTLTGHKLGTTCIAFSNDVTLAISCSEDGCINLWNINVRWHMSEEPRLLASFEDTDYSYFTHAAISPNNKVAVLATPSTSLIFFRLDSTPPTLLGEITDAHATGPLLSLSFTSKHVLATAAAGDNKIKTWDLSKNCYKLSMK